jgi:lipopolysaccharide assembly outer membrane protein LptD (OstA)
MRKLPFIAALISFAVFLPLVASAQKAELEKFGVLYDIDSTVPMGSFDMVGDVITATNGFYIKARFVDTNSPDGPKYTETVLTADSGIFNKESGDVQADGHVRIMQGDMLYVGEHIDYNFKTRQMRSQQFRTGKPPIFLQGRNLHGNTTNQTYVTEHAKVTTDDVSNPASFIRSRRIIIVPDKYFEAWNSVVFLKGVPVFYYPYYKRNLGPHANNWNFTPGYSSDYGAYLLGTYTWWLNDEVDGALHTDYRAKRGPGIGPDFNLHLDRWGLGNAQFRYYYIHDSSPNTSLTTNSFPNLSGTIPENRQRFYMGWQATPATNLNVKAMVNYQSDPLMLHDFFQGEYTANPQPITFVEANKYSDNWSLDALTTPRINDFFDQVERLPDVKLTGQRQQIGETPVFYESESSAGYYRTELAETNSLFAGTNGPNFDVAAARADTYQQLLLPQNYFGWLNVTPRAGARFTYYSHETGPGATNDTAYRRVYNLGIDFDFKVSRLWAGATNRFFDIDGLRHIMEPSASYAFIPNPSDAPSKLPQFDSQSPSPLLLPIQLPDYNNIDSIDSENVIRYGLRNTLQTKRGGHLDNFMDWRLLLDWRLNPQHGQSTFNDLFSDYAFRPKRWLEFDSQIRYDINQEHLNLANHNMTIAPNEKWSWSLGHIYSRSEFLPPGNNFISSTMLYRMNDNWGFRATHYYNAGDGLLQDQFYTIYRDLRSWTGALTFRITENANSEKNYTIAFTFSIKAHPRQTVGSDTAEPYHLVGQ